METKLTARHVEALEAALYDKPAHYRNSGRRNDGTILWTMSHHGGGSVTRMIKQLRERGLLFNHARSRLADELGLRWRDLPELPEELTADKGGLSVKGLEALDQYLRSGRRYDPTDVRLQMIKDQLVKRRELDAAYDAFLTNYRDREKAAYARKCEAEAKAANAGTRDAVAALGFDAAALTDDQLVQLRRDIDQSVHGSGWVRFLDDADLSAELDAAEKEAHRPGTLGSNMRTEKLNAIRAEFKRREDAENDPDYSNPK